MCRFYTREGGPVDVSKTRISVMPTRVQEELPGEVVQFMGPAKYGYQITTYGNTMQTPGGGVMVVGVNRGPILLLGSPKIDGVDLFRAVNDYIDPSAEMVRNGLHTRGGGSSEPLEVVRSGDYNVSVARNPEDLLRLSDQLGGPASIGMVNSLVEDARTTGIPQSFVVFQLAADADKKANNSLAFMHHRNEFGSLRIPLKHNGHDEAGKQLTTPLTVSHDAIVHVYETQVAREQWAPANMRETRHFLFADADDLEFRGKITDAFRYKDHPVSLIYPPCTVTAFRCVGRANNFDPCTA